MGRETHTAMGYVQELMLYMIDMELDEYRIPDIGIPIDFSSYPFRIVKKDKIFKVLNLFSDGEDVEEVRSFTFLDVQMGKTWRFSFRHVDDNRYWEVTKTAVEDA